MKGLRFDESQESRFQAAKRSEMCSAFMQGFWFADAQESRVQFAKRSDMGIAVMKVLRFADVQESCFEAWKRAHMCCVALLCGRFADTQEERIQAANRSKMWSAVPQWLICWCWGIAYSGSRNIQMWVVPSRKDFDKLILRNRFFKVSKIWFMGSAVRVSGWSAGIQEFCFQAANVQIWILPNCKGSICWLLGMALSGCETFR